MIDQWLIASGCGLAVLALFGRRGLAAAIVAFILGYRFPTESLAVAAAAALAWVAFFGWNRPLDAPPSEVTVLNPDEDAPGTVDEEVIDVEYEVIP